LNHKWPTENKDEFNAMSNEEVYERMFNLKRFDIKLDNKKEKDVIVEEKVEEEKDEGDKVLEKEDVEVEGTQEEEKCEEIKLEGDQDQDTTQGN